MNFFKINIALTITIVFSLINCTNNTHFSDHKNVIVNTPLLYKDSISIINKDSGYTQAASVIDLNNDGYPEIFATNTGNHQSNFFYQNKNGVFIKDTLINITLDQFRSNGCSWADFDNNNTLDLVIANRDDSLNLIYINTNEKTRFKKERLIQKNIDQNWSYGASWCDVNNDGHLDLFITNYKNQKNTIYKNNNGVLEEISVPQITNQNFSSLHAVWVDLNNDLKQDLIISEEGENHIYKNNGDFNFELINKNNLTLNKGFTYGCSPADFNNDGFTDLFFTNWAGKNELYINLGNLNFKKISNSDIAQDYDNSEGSCWGDYNNDGYIDLIVTNDGTNRLYKNVDGKSFKKINIPGLTDIKTNSNGVVWIDANNNGFLDLFVCNGNNERNQFFKNKKNNNNYIKIKLTGSKSNKSAIGSKVKLYYNESMQTQEVSSQHGGGCGSQKSLILHFGLSKNTRVDSLIILWPSGNSNKLYNLKVNSKYEVIE